MANNYSGWIRAQTSCEQKADDTVKYGTPVWPHSWIPNFNSFHGGADYKEYGQAVLVEHDAQFQNAFSAMVHSTVTCTYDLNAQKVVDISIVPN